VCPFAPAGSVAGIGPVGAFATAPFRATVAVSCSARSSTFSHRERIGPMRPPPTPTTRMPPTVASTVISTGSVTSTATPIWESAAMTPSPMMNTWAMVATTRPYESADIMPATRSFTAAAMAAATTTMIMATMMRGRNVMMLASRALTGLSPNAPNAICSVISRIA
jgi:hypothetical protein